MVRMNQKGHIQMPFSENQAREMWRMMQSFGLHNVSQNDAVLMLSVMKIVALRVSRDVWHICSSLPMSHEVG